MTNSKMPEVVRAGTRWPSGTYSEVALLRIRLEDIAERFESDLESGVEPGLGPWQGIGLKLGSEAFVELIEYLHSSSDGVELRTDSACDLSTVLDETLATLGVGRESVLWQSPLISR